VSLLEKGIPLEWIERKSKKEVKKCLLISIRG
jgi:hypothetical protein